METIVNQLGEIYVRAGKYYNKCKQRAAVLTN